MSVTMACIAGEEIYRQLEGGKLVAKSLGRRETPFGPSQEIFLVEAGQPFYLMPRYGGGLSKTPAGKINHLANMYALKDIGVCQVLSWGPGGAVTHNIAVGDLVILDDLIDWTYLRRSTYFEDSPLGILRQFPVFCESLRKISAQVLDDMKLRHHASGTVAVTEGPRLETPAEVRMLAGMGAQVVSHNFVPEAFLAKELELCYAAICYVVNYAETGSKHRPFTAGELFGGLSQRSDREQLTIALASMNSVVRDIAAALAGMPRQCGCDKTMAHYKNMYNLDPDWRVWIK